MPNVIIVLTDDQGYGDLSCHGNPVLKTPNLDQLQTESVRFTDFHVSAMCTPSRGQILTGIDAFRNGATCVSRGRSLIQPGIPTMADLFSANGYKTAIFGKWHLGDNYPYRPQDRGFQETVHHSAWGITSIPDYWTNDYFDDKYLHNGVYEEYEGYCTDVWFNETMKWMKERQKNDEPFFVYLPTNAPHSPLWVAEKYSEPYSGYPEVKDFYGMISNIDENMGRLMSMLDETGLRENTILIFMTDNGTSVGHKVFNAGMRGHKTELYDGGHRVPFFISWPEGDIGEARDVNELAQGQDIFPTLMDLCKLKAAEPLSVDGISLAEVLSGKNNSLPERMLVVQYDRHFDGLTGKWESAVLWNKWRLVNGEELYNIDTDPGQEKDLSGEHPNIIEKMRDHYEKWWSEVEPGRSKLFALSIGSDEEDPVKLSSCDWDGAYADNWWQLSGGGHNGNWHLLVEESAEYEFELRRWPAEADAPISASVTKPGYDNEGKALPIVMAGIKIADVELSKPVSPDDKSITFKINLNAGDTQLKTWFLDEHGNDLCGAYYVSARKL
ncbi:MAG: arylsulfatase [Bacteroidales bacterium]|nr:arylsulfatase [Bacteroidales bacterium]